MVRVKICGLTRSSDAIVAAEQGAWALGFIFYPKSPRYVQPEQVAQMIEGLQQRKLQVARTVGVFVNSRPDDIRRVVEISGVNTVQLHGDEGPEIVDELEGLEVIKAFRLSSVEQLLHVETFEGKVSAFLFDAAVAGQYGGTGRLSDWELIAQVRSKTPIILSGGLHPDNSLAAITRLQPYAIDLSSGVEEAPGLKNPQLIRKLFQVLGESHACST